VNDHGKDLGLYTDGFVEPAAFRTEEVLNGIRQYADDLCARFRIMVATSQDMTEDEEILSVLRSATELNVINNNSCTDDLSEWGVNGDCWYRNN
jgi:hypothetical protein